MEVLGLIPARGGSKSIPRKNIRSFAGHPLIAYSIAAGKSATIVSRVVVSTDDEDIAKIARSYGAETPFLRPKDISLDHTSDLPVFQHALQWLAEQEGYKPDMVVQLRPTSPLRRVEHIDRSLSYLLEHPEADSVRTVCVPFQNPYKMWRIEESGFLKPLISCDIQEAYNQPRQALPEVYWQTGYVDAIWSDTIMKKNSMTGDRILPVVIDPEDWIDIDSPADWQRAERLLITGEIKTKDLGFLIR